MIAEYVYESNGRRLRKAEDGLAAYYIGKYAEVQKSGSNITQNNYIFANGQRAARLADSDLMTLYHVSHLSSTDAVTDRLAHITTNQRYFPFGAARTDIYEKYAFAGKERDAVANVYYFEFRYYDPSIKRFLQPDTIIFRGYDPQSLSRYSYARNSPLTFADPSGHKFQQVSGRQSNTSQSITNWFGTPFSPIRSEGRIPSLADEGVYETYEYIAPRTPLDSMKKGGYGYNESGLATAKYSGGRHNGVDLKADADTPFVAPEAGSVTFAGKQAVQRTDKTWGAINKLVFNGESGREYIFLHLREFNETSKFANATAAHPVENIEQGDNLGAVGPTYSYEKGFSTGPHLHLSIKENGVYINPNSVFEISR